jgi:hypothetical protein
MTNEKKSNVSNEKAAIYKYAKTKKRNWTFLIYPESAPSDWMDILRSTGLPIAISPLHNKDKNPTGEVKKAHYHLILCYPGPTTGSVVKSLTDDLNQPWPMPIDSVQGVYRYLTHQDNQEKYQYSSEDIVLLNGFNIRDYADLSTTDKARIKIELIKLIKEKCITEYSDFMDKMVELDKDDYFFVASSNTLFFNSYITSLRNKIKDEQNKNYYLINKETGEILDN